MVNSRRLSLENQGEIQKKSSSLIGYRHLQCLLLFFGIAVIFATRVNLSIAIVAMTDKNVANPDFPELAWSEQTKSHVLSSFFCGYILLQIPSGSWARRYGGHRLMLLSVGITSLLALLTPIGAIYGDWPVLCFLRFGQGLAQGLLLPAIATIMSKWAPVEERSAMQTFAYCGGQLGVVAMLAGSGALCFSRWGWPSTFYIPGAMGFIWTAIWLVCGASTPRDCKHISVAERTMIEESLSGETKVELNAEDAAVHAVPWRAIFTSKHFLVLIFNSCANDWVFWTLLTQIPTYINTVLGKDINSNALLSALPYLSMFGLSLLLCPLASWLEKSKLLHATVSRKIFNTLGFWIPAMTLIALGYLHRDQGDLAIGLLTVTVSCSTNLFFGYSVNHLDLAPNLAGTLLGILNCISNMTGILTPLVVGCIVTERGNIHQWRIVFFIAAGFAFFGNLLFLKFGTAKTQWWNERQRVPQDSEQREQLVADTNKAIITTTVKMGGGDQ